MRLPLEVARHYLEKAPVNLEQVASSLGIEVARDNRLPAAIAGKIERVGKGYRIVLNGDDIGYRQRFTLAHELAHYFLHRDLIGDGVTDSAMFRSKLSDTHEQQANRFAADLLMPTDLVREAWRSGQRSFAQIAQMFDVSIPAAKIRLQDLGYGA